MNFQKPGSAVGVARTPQKIRIRAKRRLAMSAAVS
jgi:hypothetical protein